ncbi:acylphosphatase [Catalinimonas niigatensis]|uniref:acylphosphatase n=1 Tax=Catalinimonas niigatensis TaxID=1397264 RepID=UPI002666DA02|nr:acylphosphatase [Catalinimonas niigatensis]WPP48140.1 acylphosphatase [Catalinimonas niigatensis]
MKKHYTIRVYGKVQGVFFRANAQDKAESLGVLGWVKNEPDGSVIIEAEGPEEALDEFFSWCKHGPTYAKVERVEYEEQNTQGFARFEIKR